MYPIYIHRISNEYYDPLHQHIYLLIFTPICRRQEGEIATLIPNPTIPEIICYSQHDGIYRRN